MPKAWQDSHVALILKRGGKAENIQDYRLLTVTSVIYRAFTHILKEWISTWAEATLPSGAAEWFPLTQRVEIARKEGWRLICCSLDVEKAYDYVPHTKLFDRLSRLGLPEILPSTVSRLYLDHKVTAHFGMLQTGQINVHRGL